MIATVLVLILLQTRASASGVMVHQTPPFILKTLGEDTNEISCSHSIKDYDVMLWYKQNRNGTMEFLGFITQVYPMAEDHLKGKVEFTGDGRRQSELIIKNLSLNDNAVYFCATITVLQISPSAVTKQASRTYLG